MDLGQLIKDQEPLSLSKFEEGCEASERRVVVVTWVERLVMGSR